MRQSIPCLAAPWPSNFPVVAFTTMRFNPLELTQDFNLSLRVNDDTNQVMQRRAILNQSIQRTIPYLHQTHGTDCIIWADNLAIHADDSYPADACISTNTTPCAVLTADCIPLLVTSTRGHAVAAIHAGWRGLADGIIQKTIDAFMTQTNTQACDILVHIGPCIGPQAFVVDAPVCEALQHSIPEDISQFFLDISPTAIDGDTRRTHKYAVHLVRIAIHILERMGVPRFAVTGGDVCTFFDTRFYSHRRAQALMDHSSDLDIVAPHFGLHTAPHLRNDGRMISLIYRR